jgi:hypothetical protein
LRRLANDKTSLYMSECITKGGVAEVFVDINKGNKDVVKPSGSSKSNSEQIMKEIEKFKTFYSSCWGPSSSEGPQKRNLTISSKCDI